MPGGDVRAGTSGRGHPGGDVRARPRPERAQCGFTTTTGACGHEMLGMQTPRSCLRGSPGTAWRLSHRGQSGWAWTNVHPPLLERDAWFNSQRLMRRLGYRLPAEYLEQYHRRHDAPVEHVALNSPSLLESRGGSVCLSGEASGRSLRLCRPRPRRRGIALPPHPLPNALAGLEERPAALRRFTPRFAAHRDSGTGQYRHGGGVESLPLPPLPIHRRTGKAVLSGRPMLRTEIRPDSPGSLTGRPAGARQSPVAEPNEQPAGRDSGLLRPACPSARTG